MIARRFFFIFAFFISACSVASGQWSDTDQELTADLLTRHPELASALSDSLVDYVASLNDSGVSVTRVYEKLREVDNEAAINVCLASGLAVDSTGVLDSLYLRCTFEYLSDCNPKEPLCAEVLFFRQGRFVGNKDAFFDEMAYMYDNFDGTYAWEALFGLFFKRSGYSDLAYEQFLTSIELNLKSMDEGRSSYFVLKKTTEALLEICSERGDDSCMEDFGWILQPHNNPNE